MGRKINVIGVAKRERYLYALAENINYIFVIDLVNLKITSMMELPCEDYIDGRLYGGIYIEGDNMLLTPVNAKKAWLYSFGNSEWVGVDLSGYINDKVQNKFMGGNIISGVAYLFGYAYHGIIQIDTRTYEVKEVLKKDDWAGGFLFNSIITDNSEVQIPIRHKNSLLSISGSKREYQLIDFAQGENTSSNANNGIAYDGNVKYVLKHNGDFVYKIKDNTTTVIKLCRECYANASFYEGIECFANKLLIYGKTEFNCFLDLNNPDEYYVWREKIFFAKRFDGVGLVLCTEGKVKILDDNLDVIYEFDMVIDDESIGRLLATVDTENAVFMENGYITLTDYISFIKNI